MQGIASRVKGFGQLWGFDSFTGLPSEARGVRTEGRHWNPGAFSSADAMSVHSSSALFNRLTRKIGRIEGNVTFVPGFFNESLTPELLRQHSFQPALFVDVDGDLYVSARRSRASAGCCAAGSLCALVSPHDSSSFQSS